MYLYINRLGHLYMYYIQHGPNADLEVPHELEFIANLCTVCDGFCAFSVAGNRCAYRLERSILPCPRDPVACNAGV